MKLPGIGAMLALLASATIAAADERHDDEMLALAHDHGCYLCHGLSGRKPGGQEAMPSAPAWTDIARRYRGRADAVDRLTWTVLQGTQPGLTERHWKGKVREQAMPPNAIEISEADARLLVQWVLSLYKE